MSKDTDTALRAGEANASEEAWPKRGPSFNAWHVGTLSKLAALLEEAGDEYWWTADSQLKYVRINVDTRDGGYTLSDRDGNSIDPDRIEKAIAKNRASNHGNRLKLHAKAEGRTREAAKS